MSKRYKAKVTDSKTGTVIAESDPLDSHDEAFIWGCDQGDSWPDSYKIEVVATD
jgi:hypothetical protein